MAYTVGGGLSQEFLEELKFKCDIVSTVSQYLPVTKRGSKYFAVCPFHGDKNASMCVNPDGQYYHCFGCGASGNVISFIMEMESLTFMEAVRLLAEKVGMEMPEYKYDPDAGKKKEKSEILRQLMRDSALYYRNNLTKEKEGAAAREYLNSRGITDEVAKHYGMGLSLGYDGLQTYMRRKGYSIENLRDCGLVSGEALGDAFANRIIVPIMDPMGNVIAFGGRIYRPEDKDNPAKYKNSTNTLIFDKSNCLYGVNFIKKEKRENTAFTELILVEGYMDVISLGAAGIRNAVAGMGTALTPGQARELKRLAPNILVCYDDDGAGHKATVRNISILAEAGLNVKVVSLVNGYDPDDMIRKRGAGEFLALTRAALPIVDYKLRLCEEAYDLASVDGRAKYVRAALIALQDIKSEAEKDVYLSVVAGKSGASVESLRKDLLTTNRPVSVREGAVAATEREEKIVKASRFVVGKLLFAASYADRSFVLREWLVHPTHKAVFDFVTAKESKPVVADLFDAVPEDGEINKLLSDNTTFTTALAEQNYYYDCLLAIANEYISGRLELLKKKYEHLTDPDEKRDTVVEIKNYQLKLKSKNIKDKL